jgi:hypothetical protein
MTVPAEHTRMPIPLTRRACLRSFGAALATLALSSAPFPTFARSRPGSAPTGAHDPCSILQGSESAIALGRAYLDHHPEEADPDRLLACLRADLQELSGETTLLADGLRELVQRDFDRVRLVDVEGWLLATSEARLCALAALACATS